MAFLGLFGKKKKEEEFPGIDSEGIRMPDFEESALPPEEQPPIGAPPGFGMPGFSPMQQSGMQMQQQTPQYAREYEILSAKMDALKAILDSINQRLENIERIARGEQERYYR